MLILIKYTRELKNFAKRFDNKFKKTIKNLKENKGDKNMEYMEYTTTNENTLIVSFKFKNKITGADTMFNYEVPFEVFIEAVKDYFDKHFDVVLDGKDKDVWNMFVDLGEKVNADIIQEFIEDDEIIKELQDRLEEEAHEKFDELCQEEAEENDDEDLEEYLTESKKTEQDWENELEDDNSEIFHTVNSLQSKIDYGSPYADEINQMIDDIHDAFISGNKDDLELQLSTARVSFLDDDNEDGEVTDDEISEALADYQWQITDSTTVGQYAQETADKLGCSKEQVLKVILNENPNIREDERMAKVAGLDDEEDEEARYKAIGDDEDLDESYEIDKLEESDLYPILEARGVQEEDLERAASIVYAMYYDENFESGFADDMVSKEDLLDLIDGDLDERVEQLYGDEPFAANFDEDDVEWLKGILGLN